MSANRKRAATALLSEEPESVLGNTVSSHTIHDVLSNATDNIIQDAIKNGEITYMTNAQDVVAADERKNDTRTPAVRNMARRMQAEHDIIVAEIEEIDREIEVLQAKRTDKMHAASMLSHGLAAGE
jgi:ABC-type methionine transport system ATPase subunit